MKTVLLAMATLVAVPAFAQTTPQAAPDPAMAAPQDQSAMPAPSQTPPAATPDAGVGTPPAAGSTAPMGTDNAAAMPAPAASTGKLPWCRAGQYTGCRERSNARGQGMRKN